MSDLYITVPIGIGLIIGIFSVVYEGFIFNKGEGKYTVS